MRRFICLLVVCAAWPGLVCAQAGKAARQLNQAAKGAAKGGAKGAGNAGARQAPRSIPGKQIERLQKMTPEQREKALSNLPPERRQQVEQQLERLQNMRPEVRDELDRRFEKLQSFPPARQRAVRQEVQSLRGMPFEDRRARLNSEEFRQQYSSDEQDLIRSVFPGAAR